MPPQIIECTANGARPVIVTGRAEVEDRHSVTPAYSEDKESKC